MHWCVNIIPTKDNSSRCPSQIYSSCTNGLWCNGILSIAFISQRMHALTRREIFLLQVMKMQSAKTTSRLTDCVILPAISRRLCVFLCVLWDVCLMNNLSVGILELCFYNPCAMWMNYSQVSSGGSCNGGVDWKMIFSEDQSDVYAAALSTSNTANENKTNCHFWANFTGIMSLNKVTVKYCTCTQSWRPLGLNVNPLRAKITPRSSLGTVLSVFITTRRAKIGFSSKNCKSLMPTGRT